MSSKLPKFHTNSLDFAQSSVQFSPNFQHFKIQYKPTRMLESGKMTDSKRHCVQSGLWKTGSNEGGKAFFITVSEQFPDLSKSNWIKFIAAICATRKFRMVVAWMVIMPHFTLNSYQ